MTDQEINRRLALAIGWTSDRMRYYKGDSRLFLKARMFSEDWDFYVWRPFDYREWNVAAPIAERYDCFPQKTDCGDWIGFVPWSRVDTWSDTPQKAIALAVIAAHKAGVLK